MTDLSRSLITAAREGLAPDAATAARVRAKVAAAISAGAATTTATTQSVAAVAAKPATAPVASGSASLLLKLSAALIAVGLVATAIIALGPERSPEAPQLAVSATEPAEVRAPERVAAPDAPLVRPDARHTVKRAVPVAMPAPAAAAAPAAEPEPASLSREVELIDLAMVSLRKHAPAAAIEAIRVFDRETLGQGQMAEDAAAIEIEARCRLGYSVTSQLAHFDRRWPESAQRERLQTACFSR